MFYKDWLSEVSGLREKCKARRRRVTRNFLNLFLNQLDINLDISLTQKLHINIKRIYIACIKLQQNHFRKKTKAAPSTRKMKVIRLPLF